MLTTIKGTYNNGEIILDEIPPIKNKSKVIITILEESPCAPLKKRRLGSLKGKIGLPDNFNEPIQDLQKYMY